MPRNTNEEGIMRVMLVPGKEDRKMVVHGRRFAAPANADTDDDAVYEETREIQGAWVEVSNHEPGDYVEMTLRGDTGEGEVELGKHGESVYIPPSGKVEQIVSEGTVSFPAGFKLRMRYHAVAVGSPRDVYAWYRMRK